MARGDAIHLRSAVALLGRFPALAGLDLDVSKGEVVLLHGPNGAGKTTVLRVCAGLVGLARGDGEVLGLDLRRDRRAIRRRVGMITPLYDDLTVMENVTFAARAVSSDFAAGALERLGLAGRVATTPVGKLSTGQRRRAGLAVVVARRPELWLLDEPHAGLDADARDLLDELIRAAVADGCTVVLASHELDRAEPLATRTLAVGGGVIQEMARVA